MGRRPRIVLLAVALAGSGVAAVGCGAEDFPNDPRPPAPIELTAKVGDDQVLVSPTKIDGKPIGAGLATVTIANLSADEAQLNFNGPQRQTTDPIIAGGTLNFKLDLKQGRYTVSSDDAAVKPASFTVGPERPSAQNDLLLP